jgi:hypothetical protein
MGQVPDTDVVVADRAQSLGSVREIKMNGNAGLIGD